MYLFARLLKGNPNPLRRFLVTMSVIPGNVFIGKSDRFKGITVVSGDESCTPDDFDEKLTSSLQNWTENGVRGVWFNVNLSEAAWIPILVKHGFTFHHAQPETVSMVKWLPKDEENRIPQYAHHMIGVGGMVVNQNDEVLVVQERFRFQQHWKLPGGYVDPGENLAEAAIREVQEETGIQTEFSSIIAIRHAHGYNFGCSDLYIIVELKPLVPDQPIEKCDRELSDCRWMPIQEYINCDIVHDLNKFFAKKFLENRSQGICIGLTKMELRIKDFVREQQVYSLQKL